MIERLVRTVLALVVPLALVWALVVSIQREHYGFGLGFAIILATLVAIALISSDAALGRSSEIPVDVDQRRQRMVAAADRLTRLRSEGDLAPAEVRQQLADAEQAAMELLITEAAELGWAMGLSATPVDPRQLVAGDGDQEQSTPG